MWRQCLLGLRSCSHLHLLHQFLLRLSSILQVKSLMRNSESEFWISSILTLPWVSSVLNLFNSKSQVSSFNPCNLDLIYKPTSTIDSTNPKTLLRFFVRISSSPDLSFLGPFISLSQNLFIIERKSLGSWILLQSQIILMSLQTVRKK